MHILQKRPTIMVVIFAISTLGHNTNSKIDTSIILIILQIVPIFSPNHLIQHFAEINYIGCYELWLQFLPQNMIGLLTITIYTSIIIIIAIHTFTYKWFNCQSVSDCTKSIIPIANQDMGKHYCATRPRSFDRINQGKACLSRWH